MTMQDYLKVAKPLTDAEETLLLLAREGVEAAAMMAHNIAAMKSAMWRTVVPPG